MSNFLGRLIFPNVACLLIASHVWAYQFIYTPRQTLLYGICQLPFPAITGLDYPFCRAQAWLTALDKAQTLLPASWEFRLRQLGADASLVRLAVASLAYPLDVATPEKTVNKEVRVFLAVHANEQLTKSLNHIAASAWLVLLEMCIIWETSQAVEKLKQIWPKSVQAASAQLVELDHFANLLQELWLANNLTAKELAGEKVNWGELGNPKSLAATLALATQTEAAPLIEKAMETCINREIASGPGPATDLWNRLASYALFLRANAHVKSAQPGLAEADFSAALARLQKGGVVGDLPAAIYLARANLRRSRHDQAGMCADFSAACALGQCQGLAAARRAGLCSSHENQK